MLSTRMGKSGTYRRGRSNNPNLCFWITSMAVAPENGVRPVIMAYITAPRRIQITLLAGPFSLGLLGGHVLGGANDATGHRQAIAGENLGHAKIREFDEPLGRHEQIGRLQVAMNDARVMRRLQCLADVNGNLERPSPGEPQFTS